MLLSVSQGQGKVYLETGGREGAGIVFHDGIDL